MRPRKKILIYHPRPEDASIFRFAMETTLHQRVIVARTVSELSGDGIDLSVKWSEKHVNFHNPHTGLKRAVPVECSNTELMDLVRFVIRRKGRFNA